jgi:hypothetical protein
MITMTPSISIIAITRTCTHLLFSLSSIFTHQHNVVFLVISGLTAFWAYLKSYDLPIEENQVIQLPLNTYILGNSSLGSSIFIRPCYPKLLAIALTIIHDHDSPHLVILGNPGIGKTFFGYFILLTLAKLNSTVVYERGKENTRYLFANNGISIGTKEDFRDYLRRDTTYYIVDASPPVDVAAKTILLSSPHRDVWYKFSDDHCDIRYMPTWSLEEIEICRQKLFNHLVSDDVKNLFGKWGGIPCYVLKNAKKPAQQRKLDNAITAVDLNVLVKAVGNPESLDSATHHLIHLNVADDFCTVHNVFASAYVADKVYLQLYEMKRMELTNFLAASKGIVDLGALRGILFERHAHKVISNGGTFQIRELYDQDLKSHTTTLQLKSLPQLICDSESEVLVSVPPALNPFRE